jgi:ATP-dependent helicase YprA (DUF1998 family)
MQLTPNQAFEQLRDAAANYIETSFKLVHPSLKAELSQILRQPGIIAQTPFIEATPAFPTKNKLAELELKYPSIVPTRLHELVQHGLPIDRFPLYTHQQEALLAAFGPKPNLLVATGTGSGKTESFLLPILADIMREATKWQPPAGPLQNGEYEAGNDVWLPSRRQERRPAALRAIVLYPMNALVNDQLSRLRRILALNGSPQWQHANFNGNLIHFGMYTGLSRPTGSYHEPMRRQRYEEYYRRVEQDWLRLRIDLQATGSWPVPRSPEMLCRWDMQAAPPDILVTNYSMLEYMLLRPIENNIFEQTRQWLETTPEARLTLVLDEAHTYTGAKGTEVAYLIHRLKERLGIASGSEKFRAIATTASLPTEQDDRLYRFAAELMAEPAERFSIIRAEKAVDNLPPRSAQHSIMEAFANFHERFDIQNPDKAIEQLAHDLNLETDQNQPDSAVKLYKLLEESLDIRWIRQRTARNATSLETLAEECWQGLGSELERDRATAGLLSAGSFARPTPQLDTPPLLSMRVHSFIRGLPGLWACLNPACPELPPELRPADLPRPVGKLYTEPRAWCSPECGARVLELFACRHCGLLFVGGIPDDATGSLWPWSADLENSKQNLQEYAIFGVEQPSPEVTPTYRSIRSTLERPATDPSCRPVYEIVGAAEGPKVQPFPQLCPRCRNSRFGGENPREVIEPLHSRGPRSFTIIAEQGFRIQPRTEQGQAPNYGRKALLFSDSRMEAAQLAADLRNGHHNDLFRQLLFRVLYSCPACLGLGYDLDEKRYGGRQLPCLECLGKGQNLKPEPLNFKALRSKVIKLQIELGINPTNGQTENFFELCDINSPEWSEIAEEAFHIALRRELSEDVFGLEPLGLAGWQLRLPDRIEAFNGLSDLETRLLLNSVGRLLACENILLPPQPLDPWSWNEQLLEEYERKVLIRGIGPSYPRLVFYNLKHYNKLGRYVQSLAKVMVSLGKVPSADAWVTDLENRLWKVLGDLRILQGAGARINDRTPYGIRLDQFELRPVSNIIQQCRACDFVMSQNLLNVCLRCGQPTRPIEVSKLNNYYRRSAFYALPESGYDDPYPLRAVEHTAQIAGSDARDYERWFQDLFHDSQHPQDYRIDILSVTTTMEMGIDIGSLLSVGLRNVPPSVANYQQRAGRAGRRGSSIATVMAYAQFRSHDHYYFDRPPEIVSGSPRVPVLYLNNPTIARRHIRSLILQSFFYYQYKHRVSSNLFDAWGTVADFGSNQSATKLSNYIGANRAPLLQRCRNISHPEFQNILEQWLNDLVSEVQNVVERSDEKAGLMEQLIRTGLLPKYAFPVDVVSLNIPVFNHKAGDEEDLDTFDGPAMQRDLKIALSEYVPGAEIIRGEFPNTYVYRSAGLYDPYAKAPSYRPQGQLFECKVCQSVKLLALDEIPPDQCPECLTMDISAPLFYFQPGGFTVDVAMPNAGRKLYKGGGRERVGYTPPAQLLLSDSSFSKGQSQGGFAPRLYVHTYNGDLFCCNKGANRDFPGFYICPECGRELDPASPGRHKYPVSIPPHSGPDKGPRAGTPCPNISEFENQLILGYQFRSDVLLLGVDLPFELDAPIKAPSGKAIWYSFGTLVANAAAIVLQVEAGELKVGIRPARRAPGRVHGEVFIYDDVPGGAGYARAVAQNLEEILNKALELGHHCPNPTCAGACYHCLYDYRNQLIHPLLDRRLGTAILEYLLYNKLPVLDEKQVEQYVAGLEEYARTGYIIRPGVEINGTKFSRVLERTGKPSLGLWVIHPLRSWPSRERQLAIRSSSQLVPAVQTAFDLERRPFWVINHLVNNERN